MLSLPGFYSLAEPRREALFFLLGGFDPVLISCMPPSLGSNRICRFSLEDQFSNREVLHQPGRRAAQGPFFSIFASQEGRGKGSFFVSFYQ